MESLGIIRAAGVVASALGLFLIAVAWAARQRRRRFARGRGPDRVMDRAGPGADLDHRLELRLAALEHGQAGLATRLDGAGGAEERLQATAGQLLGLVRDKNATLETALAGLDQLRSRMRTLEQIGDAAEARGLFERLGERLASLESAQAAAQAATEAALAARGDGAPQALVEQLTRLHAQKDAAVEAVLARLAPVEARLGRLEGEAPAEALARLELRLDGLRDAQGATQAALTALRLEGAGPVAEIAERLSRLHAQKDALAERLLARLGAVETEIAARDPGTALDGLAERLEALRGRVALLETPAENPYAEIAGQLTTLYAQKDAATEAVFARLAPLEARLGALETGLAARDPQAALDALRDRLEAAQALREAAEAALRDRLAALETPAENPYAEIAGQLTTLYAQKDAATEAVFARLAPLEARLGAVETGLAARDPQAALDGLRDRLEAAQALREAAEAALRDRLAALETQENPYAGIAEQLTGLYAQKDALAGTVLARLGAVEAGFAAYDPQAALDGLRDRLEAAQALREAAEAALRDRLAALETQENPFAGIAEQLAGLYAQKDVAVETVLAKLAPLEARLGEVETGLADRDPQAALDGFAARLEALRDRLAVLETPGETPYAAIAAQLAGLYAQKDAAVEAVLAKLGPLEARLAEVAAEAKADLAAADPSAALDAVAARVAALETPGENPYAAIAAQLAGLYAQKDAAVEAVLTKLAPLDERIEALRGAQAAAEAGLAERLRALEGDGREAEDAARAEAQAIATQLIAMRAAAAQTELFADRIALLEASLPRLSVSQSLMMQALERQAAAPAAEAAPGAPEPALQPATTPGMAPETTPETTPGTMLETVPETAPEPADPLEAFRDLPRIVSLHQK